MSDPSPPDPAALIREHQAGVWRYLRSLGCDHSRADDLTQETFLAVLRRPFDDYDPAATASYLRTTARNLLITEERRKRRVQSVEPDVLEAVDRRWQELIAPDDDGGAAIARLRDCLGKLSERARWALEMRFRERMPRVEIADGLGITDHGARNLMQRAKGQLKKCLEQSTAAAPGPGHRS